MSRSDDLIEKAWNLARHSLSSTKNEVIELLQEATNDTKNTLARYNLAKAYAIFDDNRFYENIEPYIKIQFGPALYLMAQYKLKKNEKNTAIEYLIRAACVGHLPSKGLLWHLEKKTVANKILALPNFIFVVFQAFIIKIRDPADVRVME